MSDEVLVEDLIKRFKADIDECILTEEMIDKIFTGVREYIEIQQEYKVE